MTATVDLIRPTPPPAAPSAGDHAKTMVGSLAALTAIIVALLMLFVLPSLRGGAHGIPVGTVGDAGAVTTALTQVAPEAFAATTFADEAALREAILDRSVSGGLVVADDSVRILTATAGSAAIAGSFSGSATAAAATLGLAVTVDDLVPYTAADPQGIGIGGLAFPLVFGGIVPAVVAFRAFPGRVGLQLASTGAFAVIGGLVVTGVLRFWFGSFDGSFLLPAAALALGIAALSVPLVGLQALFGTKGFTLLAASMMFVGNPFAGIGTSAAWLPAGVGTIGQLLPPGATGTLVRSAAYFDGAGATTALVTLVGWVVVGLALCVLGVRRAAAAEDTALADEAAALAEELARG